MNNFLNLKYVQPTIVRFKNVEPLPEEVTDKYMIQVNIPNLNTGKKIAAIYLVISEKYKKDSYNKKFADFFDAYLQSGISVLINGLVDFVPGEDYYINAAIYELYPTASEDIVLPTSYGNGTFNSTYFYDLSDTSTDLSNIDSYILQNKLVDSSFTEEELKTFNKTFSTLILENSNVQILVGDITNQIYRMVLSFYAGGGTDAVLVGLNLMLNSTYNVVMPSTSTTCNCKNNTTSQETLCSTSCVDFYTNAIKERAKEMFGNVTFYKDWFSMTSSEDPNVALIDTLIELINLLLESGYTIPTTDTSTKAYIKKCNCTDNTSDNCMKETLTNYIKVLNWVKNKETEENVNKIKIYGEQFGTLFPSLSF